LILRQARLIGLPVDRCWGEQTATLHTIAGDLPLPIGFSSCTILVDGRVVPLVNMPDLLHWLALEPPDSAASIPPPVSRVDRVAMPDQPPAAPLILIVDDSVNLRHLLALTLERAGYQVAQAEDGQAALQLLASGVPVAAILCDLEMPRLDGWGFLTQLRANSQLAQPPVTLLTARPDDHYRQRALQLGAIAYLTKPYREQDLLNTVAQMVAVHDRKI
jgi:two-component system, chemotaxis family, sensor histidine kinase and response regulator PixL